MESANKSMWMGDRKANQEPETNRNWAISGLYWAIIDDVGRLTKVVDEKGVELILGTVKGSRVLHLARNKTELTRLDLSMYVNVAKSEEEVVRRVQEKKDRK